MNSFHDQIFSEIDAARKLAADFATRRGRSPAGAPRVPSGEDRQAQEEAAAAEIAALAAEEERLASQARERAEHRARARAKEHVKTGEAQQMSQAPAPPKSRWNAMAILKGLAKLRARERSAAEELIRKAQEVRVREQRGAPAPITGMLERRQEQPAAPVRGMWTPSLGATQVWHFTSGDTRCGPVTLEELRTMAASRVLDPRHDMVWKEGMGGWQPAGLLAGLYERRTVPAGIPDPSAWKRFRKVTALPRDLTAALATKHLCWPGVGRLTLWLGILLMPVLWSQLLWWSTPTLVATFGSSLISKLVPFASIVPVVGLICLVLMRLVNVGMSRWWALMLAIPVVNLWVGYRCLVCPAGYVHHRRQDRCGMAIALAIVVAIPAIWLINARHPDLLSSAQLRTALHRLFERAEKAVSPQ